MSIKHHMWTLKCEFEGWDM